jgi:hypothetical protein
MDEVIVQSLVVEKGGQARRAQLDATVHGARRRQFQTVT